MLKHCLTIVYKCSRDNCNFQTLKKAKVLNQSQSNFDSPWDEIQRAAILSAVYLAEEKHAKIFKTTKKCRIELVVETLQSALDDEDKVYEGWPVSELLKGKNLDYVLDGQKMNVRKNTVVRGHVYI
jgi:hypothetical protein